MKKKNGICMVLLLGISLALGGCTQANRAASNVSKEADNFNVIRRLSVVNVRSDKPVFELIGAFSFHLDSNRIILTCETGPGEYKKHSIGLNEWTLWFVEDISGANVTPYRYEVNFLPEMLLPVENTMND